MESEIRMARAFFASGRLFLPNDRGRFNIPRISANHDGEFTGLPVIFQIRIVKLKFFRSDGEAEVSGFPCFQENLLKTFQLLHRPGNAASIRSLGDPAS